MVLRRAILFQGSEHKRIIIRLDLSGLVYHEILFWDPHEGDIIKEFLIGHLSREANVPKGVGVGVMHLDCQINVLACVHRCLY